MKLTWNLNWLVRGLAIFFFIMAAIGFSIVFESKGDFFLAVAFLIIALYLFRLSEK